jgi:hypothetical protein
MDERQTQCRLQRDGHGAAASMVTFRLWLYTYHWVLTWAEQKGKRDRESCLSLIRPWNSTAIHSSVSKSGNANVVFPGSSLRPQTQGDNYHQVVKHKTWRCEYYCRITSLHNEYSTTAWHRMLLQKLTIQTDSKEIASKTSGTVPIEASHWTPTETTYCSSVTITKLRSPSPRANYTDRATAACRRS